MPFYYYWGFDPTYIILIFPVLLISMYAQYKVKHTFNIYSQVECEKGLTGYSAARQILDANGLSDVAIERVSGQLTDHYDPKANVIRLSDAVYATPSVAAVGVAAHEAGHAVQHAKGYVPIKIRNGILPLAQIGSTIAFPLILIGIIFEGIRILVPVGIVLYAAVFLFQLVTLPVEFNASGRAISILGSSAMLAPDEVSGVKKVLSAAAMTYVAAMLTALAQLVRLLILAGRNDRD